MGEGVKRVGKELLGGVLRGKKEDLMGGGGG